MIDIGANLTDNRFKYDLDEVIQRAHSSAITNIIITGTSLENSQQAIVLANKYTDFLYATVGIHPHNAAEYTTQAQQNIAKLYTHKCVKAVGETGLDFHRDFSSPQQQEKAFLGQLSLAIEKKLPIFLHERDAHQRFYSIIKEHADFLTDGVVHCFTGDKKALYKYLDLNLHIGITGWICDPVRGAHLHNLVKNIPLNKLMLETDAPYLLPKTMLNKPSNRRNESCYLIEVAMTIAKCINIDITDLISATTATSKKFFNLA